MAAARKSRQHRLAEYKSVLRQFIDTRPSGIRQKIAEATGTHKSFISQITNPSDPTPLPARHIDAIFEVCHLSPEEQSQFLDRYHAAHPEVAEERHEQPRQMRTLHIRVPVLDDERKQAEMEALVRDTVRRLYRLIE